MVKDDEILVYKHSEVHLPNEVFRVLFSIVLDLYNEFGQETTCTFIIKDFLYCQMTK
jgi:hypothetical protein